MGVMKNIAIDIAEGTCRTQVIDEGETIYSYDGDNWYHNPAQAYLAKDSDALAEK